MILKCYELKISKTSFLASEFGCFVAGYSSKQVCFLRKLIVEFLGEPDFLTRIQILRFDLFRLGKGSGAVTVHDLPLFSVQAGQKEWAVVDKTATIFATPHVSDLFLRSTTRGLTSQQSKCQRQFKT